MKNYITLVFTCIMTVVAMAQPEIQWQRALGGTGREAPHGIIPTNDGGFLLLGFTESMDGDVLDSQGNGDLWLLKMDAMGSIQWSRTLGGSQFDFPIHQHLVMTSDGGFVIGGLAGSQDGDVSVNHGDGDYWLVKLDNNGAIIWEKTYGGNNGEMFSEFQQTSDGGFVLIGFTWSTEGVFSTNQGESDVYVVKTDAQGNVEWQKTYGGSLAEFGGHGHILQASDGGYFFSVTTYSSDGDVSAGYHGEIDIWSVRLDATGNILWERALGGSKDDHLVDIFSTPEGGFMVAGSSFSQDGDRSAPLGYSDSWLIKLDAEGFTAWDHSYGGTSDELMEQIIKTPDEGYLMVSRTFSDDGDITGVHAGLPGETWVAKIDADGTIQWQRALGGSKDEGFGNIINTPDGGYLVNCYTDSDDGDVNVYQGGTDAWLVKLSSTGVLQWQKTYGGTNADYPGLQPVITGDNGILTINLTHSSDGDVTGFHGTPNKEDIWLVKFGPETVAVADINSPAHGLILSPNPATQFVRVSVDTPETMLTVTISDVLGRELSRQTIMNGARISISQLPGGCYLMSTVTTSGNIFTGTLVKE